MKINRILILLFLSFFKINLFGHDQNVHEAITVNAAASALHNSPDFTDFLDAVSSDVALFTATNAMALGSFDEDDGPDSDKVGGYRSLNHFYDPLDGIYGKGLSDSVGFSGLGPIADKRRLVGNSSLVWASISNCVGIDFYGVTVEHYAKNIGTKNVWSWQNARYYEWLGLTTTNQLERQTNLLYMFKAVGHVMHLLEDASQPQHVRNEQHVDPFLPNSWREQHDPWASPIEVYGYNHVGQLNYGDGSSLDWRNTGFTKLGDFWDRHLYNGSSAALDNAESGGAQLGLAEWCNGNFLGDRHSYSEYFPERDVADGTPNIMWYPYPSLFTSTTYLKQGAFYDTEMLKNGTQIHRQFLAKTADGVQVSHLSTVSFLGTIFPNRIFPASTSIRDDVVLKAYHDLLIPKAVKYTAGLLDYFFRATFTRSVSWSSDLTTYTNTVVNSSSQDFYGGSFVLLEESSDGSRAMLHQFPVVGIFPTNGVSNFVYSGSINPTNKHILFYQGTIGVTNGIVPLDPVDAGIAIGVEGASEQTKEYDHYISDTGYTLGVPIFTNLESDDFDFTPTPGHVQAIINGGVFDDAGSIGGVSAVPADGGCGYPAVYTNLPIVIPASAITIVGNHLQVVLTDTDYCRVMIGWQGVNITWRAWSTQ